MRALLDTNVLIDYLAMRQPFTENAEKIITLCRDNVIEGVMAAHSVMNIFYILRKSFSVDERRAILTDLCELFTVIGIDKAKIISALGNYSFSDIEDCLQAVCAEISAVDYIVTRNIKDFQSSKVPVVTPSEFLTLIK